VARPTLPAVRARTTAAARGAAAAGRAASRAALSERARTWPTPTLTPSFGGGRGYSYGGGYGDGAIARGGHHRRHVMGGLS